MTSKTIHKCGSCTHGNQNIHIGHSIAQTSPGTSSKKTHAHYIYRKTKRQLYPGIHEPVNRESGYHVQHQNECEWQTEKKTFEMAGENGAGFIMIVVGMSSMIMAITVMADDLVAEIADAFGELVGFWISSSLKAHIAGS